MAFENVYLTKEEKEEFKRRNIDGPYRPVIGRGKLGFGGPFISCTMDREQKIYMFYVGQGPYNFETPPEDEYFALVWDDLMGDKCAEFCMDYKTSNIDVSEMGVWHLRWMNIPKGFEDKKTEIVEMFKEAMLAFGVIGDPRIKVQRKVKFDF